MPQDSLILINANVVTLNSKMPKARAIAVQAGRIIALGSDEEALEHKSENTKVIDCRKLTVVPGLVDCHVHMLDFGFSLQNLDLRNTCSIKEMQKRLKDYACRNRELTWILGGRWDQERFAEKRYPTRWDLDAVVSDRPVFLNRVCGHIAVANTEALRLAGITKNTIVQGGRIDLDETNVQPNGIVRENAMSLIWKTVTKPTREMIEKSCILACRKAVESGLTGVHWLLSSAEEARSLERMRSEGKLPLRIYLSVPVERLNEVVNLGLLTGFGNEMLKIGFIKILADGSLGARTAAMKKAYSDNHGKRGMMLYTQKQLQQLILKAHSVGLQLGVHAIGDRAVENVISAYEKALKKMPRKNHRHRIEHCSVLNPRLISRMKSLGLVASVQPHFVISDFWTVDRLGTERTRWAYPFKSLLKENVIVAAGSDCPVEGISPISGIWAAVAREDNPEEILTPEEALRTYTKNAAYASFDENSKGTLEPGKFADFTILSEDPTEIPPDKIRDIAVEMVIVDGKVVFSRKQFDPDSLSG